MKVAIIGCGQLARMLAMAGLPLGLQFSFLNDKDGKADIQCVKGLGRIVTLKPTHNIEANAEALYHSLGCPDVITVEKEQVDFNLLKQLNKFCAVYPPPEAIAICGDRHAEKNLLQSLQLPTSPYVFLSNNREAKTKARTLTLPLVAKSACNGYDGRNQYLLNNQNDLEAFSQENLPGTWIIEQWIGFDQEVSIIAVRAKQGEIVLYPITENVHRNGILLSSVTPALNLSKPLKKRIEQYARTLLEQLDYIGVLAIECFVAGNSIIINELAPRVHNSGHWTQSGSTTCQFENHMRAICGLPLGSPISYKASGMLNLLSIAQAPTDYLSSQSSLHWYKKTPKPGRKVGHINFWHTSREKLIVEMNRLAEKINPPETKEKHP